MPLEAAPDRSPLSFDFTTRLSVDGRTVIVLHLFRNGTSVLAKAIATVEHHEAVPVLLKCRRDLERRGIEQYDEDAILPLPVVRQTALAL